jgi:sialate O-acetylesterase
MRLRSSAGGWVLLLAAAAAARADVRPHALVSDGMVLQRGAKCTVWGKADPGEKVTAKFLDRTAEAAAGDDGVFRAVIDLTAWDGKAGHGPHVLTLSGKNTVEIKDVYVGEVWVCSGQSNMQWTVNASDASDKEAAKSAAANPLVRMFTVERIPQVRPTFDLKGAWKPATPETTTGFSAVGYFFARDLSAALGGVPVGMISTNWGGTRAEAWTRAEVLMELSPAYKAEVEKFRSDVAKTGDAPPPPPAQKGKAAPKPGQNPNAPSVLYNGMIFPVLPYAIKGAIWYQGESNAGKAYAYRDLFPAMISNWRADWKQGDFPFFFVQLAPFMKVTEQPGESNWAELREAQAMTLKLPATGMAVITDLGHEADIHPTPKKPVGERLSLIARATVYGEKVEYSGPVFKEMKVDGNKAVLTFDHVAGGLETRELVPTDERKDAKTKASRGSAWRVKAGSAGVPLTGFAVAGEDRKFHNAKAEIVGDTVVVTCEAVAKPVAVRFGWAQHPVVNLFNKAGLPASPFRTDDWPGMTAPKPQ